MPSLAAIWPQTLLLPALITLTLWVGLTVGLLRLNRLGLRAGRIALLISLPVLVLAHHEIYQTRADLSMLGAYRAFLAALLIWTWHELAFYSGVLSGPWRQPCPPQARGFSRFCYALATHLYHELACIVELIFLLVLLSGGTNATALLVFVLSWTLQHSAKLNVLLGINSLQAELFPPHLRYLASYWRSGPPSRFFRPSVSVATLLALMLWSAAVAHSADPAGVRLAFLATLMSLGAIEHWMLMLPFPVPATARRGTLAE
ncbi:MAG: DUF3623 family protein [Oscillochloris sp.]|nr:DUF3623 family protein [Oscillochloris sp.]